VLEPIDDADLVDRVRARLREAILGGSLAPGERLVESELAGRLRVSRAPVRDALRMLEFDGLVTSAGRRGRFVTVLSGRDAWEVYTLRENLEAMAFGLVVGRCPSDVLARADAIVNEMQVASDAGDRGALSELDVRFHRLICVTSDHERLLSAWDGMANLIGLLSRQVVGTQYDDLHAVPERHALLVAAIREGDVESATAAIRSHIGSVARRVMARLEAGDRGDQGLDGTDGGVR
jgi:DNA-binding GntR family transcriptional regulator